jgi:hypothetical protein
VVTPSAKRQVVQFMTNERRVPVRSLPVGRPVAGGVLP